MEEYQSQGGIVSCSMVRGWAGDILISLSRENCELKIVTCHHMGGGAVLTRWGLRVIYLRMWLPPDDLFLCFGIYQPAIEESRCNNNNIAKHLQAGRNPTFPIVYQHATPPRLAIGRCDTRTGKGDKMAVEEDVSCLLFSARRKGCAILVVRAVWIRSRAGTGCWPLSVQMSRKVWTLRREGKRCKRDKRAVGVWTEVETEDLFFLLSSRHDERAAWFSLFVLVWICSHPGIKR